jgi:5-methylcytosine-specific restriction endonuclease McrA
MAVARDRRSKAARRRKRRMDRVEHDLTAVQWTALKEAWGGCAYCGLNATQLQRDCVLPISRGGRYSLDNVVPACRSCNTSKCNAEVTGWLRRKRLDERAFLLRHVEILSGLAQQLAAAADAEPSSADEITSP